MSKFLSREFLVSLVLLIIATVALFADKCSFLEWSGACGGFLTVWTAGLTVQKCKALPPGQ